MTNSTKLNLLFIFLLVTLMGCGNNSTTPDDEQSNRLYFSPNKIELAIGEQSEITLAMSDLTEPVFGLSLQMTCDATTLIFPDTVDVQFGGFFGAEAVVFFKQTGDTLHLSITRIQGQESVSGSGIICHILVVGKAEGTGRIDVLADEVQFYDAAGEGVEIPAISFGSASVNVR